MKLNTRLSYEELHGLISELKPIIINSFLKKIYHFEGKWLFKFNNISLVYENAIIYVGEFDARENGNSIHSVCKKLRLEVGDRKIENIALLKSDRTVVITFRDFHLILECYAKGDIILTDRERKVVVLTRIYGEISHGKVFGNEDFVFNEDQLQLKFEQKGPSEMVAIETSNSVTYSAIEASKLLYANKITAKPIVVKPDKKRKKIEPNEQIERQIREFGKKVSSLKETIQQVEEDEVIDFEMLGLLHTDRKKIESKITRAIIKKDELVSTASTKIKREKKELIVLMTNKWYHAYHWWYTKNNFLVVGGRNADENEKLVKTYLKDTDYYFHSDLPGCGSFILFPEDRTPEPVDLIDTMNGVISLSQQWKMGCGGDGYWVFGNQVSKTPPSGEYITKGSFIINGVRNYMKVDTLQLGYALTDTCELMLAPYNVISRSKKTVIKLLPKPEAKKANQKKIVSLIREAFNVKDIPSSINVFNYPCNTNITKR
jgi:predicted ribosome quality control (RQC) complex YloA/Tae2 family protein